MHLTPIQTMVIILAVTLGTQITRWLPFLMFPENKQPPKVGLLVVYCFKNVSWLSGSHGAPELLAVAAVVVLHLWKKNVLLSIAGGTALYMILVQAVFA